MNRSNWLLIVLGLASCGGSGPPPTGSGPGASASESVVPPAPAPAVQPSGPVKLSFRVHAKDGESVRAIAPGETLRSGDKIALSLDLDRRAYLYVVQFFADGTAAILFPQSDEQNQLVGVTRVPSRGWFQLDDNTGEENVYVVASVRPLQEAEATIMQTLDSVRVSGAAPGDSAASDSSAEGAAGDPASDGSAPQPKKPKAKQPKKPKKPKKRPADDRPAMLSHATRAGLTTRGLQRVSDEGDAIEATTDSAGIAIVRFHFLHR